MCSTAVSGERKMNKMEYYGYYSNCYIYNCNYFCNYRYLFA